MSIPGFDLEGHSKTFVSKKSFIHVPFTIDKTPDFDHLVSLKNRKLFNELNDCDVHFHIFHFFWLSTNKENIYHQYYSQDFAIQLKFRYFVNQSRHFLLLRSDMMTRKNYPSYERAIKETYFFKQRREIYGPQCIIIPLNFNNVHWVTALLIIDNEAKQFKTYLFDPYSTANTFISDEELNWKYSLDIRLLSKTFFGTYKKANVYSPIFIRLADTFNSGIISAFTAIFFVFDYTFFEKGEFRNFREISKKSLLDIRTTIVENYDDIIKEVDSSVTNQSEISEDVQNNDANSPQVLEKGITTDVQGNEANLSQVLEKNNTTHAQNNDPNTPEVLEKNNTNDAQNNNANASQVLEKSITTDVQDNDTNTLQVPEKNNINDAQNDDANSPQVSGKSITNNVQSNGANNSQKKIIRKSIHEASKNSQKTIPKIQAMSGSHMRTRSYTRSITDANEEEIDTPVSQNTQSNTSNGGVFSHGSNGIMRNQSNPLNNNIPESSNDLTSEIQSNTHSPQNNTSDVLNDIPDILMIEYNPLHDKSGGEYDTIGTDVQNDMPSIENDTIEIDVEYDMPCIEDDMSDSDIQDDRADIDNDTTKIDIQNDTANIDNDTIKIDIQSDLPSIDNYTTEIDILNDISSIENDTDEIVFQNDIPGINNDTTENDTPKRDTSHVENDKSSSEKGASEDDVQEPPRDSSNILKEPSGVQTVVSSENKESNNSHDNSDDWTDTSDDSDDWTDTSDDSEDNDHNDSKIKDPKITENNVLAVQKVNSEGLKNGLHEDLELEKSEVQKHDSKIPGNDIQTSPKNNTVDSSSNGIQNSPEAPVKSTALTLFKPPADVDTDDSDISDTLFNYEKLQVFRSSQSLKSSSNTIKNEKGAKEEKEEKTPPVNQKQSRSDDESDDESDDDENNDNNDDYDHHIYDLVYWNKGGKEAKSPSVNQKRPRSDDESDDNDNDNKNDNNNYNHNNNNSNNGSNHELVHLNKIQKTTESPEPKDIKDCSDCSFTRFLEKRFENFNFSHDTDYDPKRIKFEEFYEDFITAITITFLLDPHSVLGPNTDPNTLMDKFFLLRYVAWSSEIPIPNFKLEGSNLRHVTNTVLKYIQESKSFISQFLELKIKMIEFVKKARERQIDFITLDGMTLYSRYMDKLIEYERALKAMAVIGNITEYITDLDRSLVDTGDSYIRYDRDREFFILRHAISSDSSQPCNQYIFFQDQLYDILKGYYLNFRDYEKMPNGENLEDDRYHYFIKTVSDHTKLDTGDLEDFYNYIFPTLKTELSTKKIKNK